MLIELKCLKAFSVVNVKHNINLSWSNTFIQIKNIFSILNWYKFKSEGVQIRLREVLKQWINYQAGGLLFDTREYKFSGMFLAISKAFDKMWHAEVIHKGSNLVWFSEFSELLTDFLKFENKDLFLTVNVHLGSASMLQLYWVNFYSWYTPIIYLIILNVILSYLLMTRPCFLLSKNLKKQLITWIMTWKKQMGHPVEHELQLGPVKTNSRGHFQ